ncbi:MAG: DUF1501 domain-containing protein [Planctomycetota bacterium]
MDGLTAIVPYAESALYQWRPTLAVPRPGQPLGAIDIDGFFGFAPSTARLRTPFLAGHLAVVHAAGSPDPTRSHFDAFKRMEFGEPGLPLGTVEGGWVARYLAATAGGSSSPLRAIAMHDFMPFSLAGARNALPIPDLANFALPGGPTSAAQRMALIDATYGRSRAPVGPAGLDTLASIQLLETVDFAGHVPANGAVYPDTQLGQRMKNTAALILADIGVEVVLLDLPDFDHHAEMGPVTGAHARLLSELSRSLEAFYLDLLAHLDDYILVVVTEFGRRLIENGSAGTDHGHGSAMFVMGGHVAGGVVHGEWPGLQVDDLDSGDLAITTDYRDVLGEVLLERLGLPDLTPVFPQHTYRSPGIIF